MRTSTSFGSIAALTMISALVAGCGASDTQPAAGPPSATHTMADGTVMNGSKISGDKTHDKRHGRHGSRPAADGPSPAARMVCTGDVVDDVTRILGLPEQPDPTAAWNAPLYTCTFELAEGPLVLTVHGASDPRTGRRHFDAVRADLGQTRPLTGMYGLGLPAYETDDGTVVFIKDGKTLRVDATALPGNLGPDDDFTQTEIAYAVATSVLACWTAHA